MQPGTMHGLLTLLALLAFAAVSAWAWSSRQRARFDAAARMPLEDDVPRNEGP